MKKFTRKWNALRHVIDIHGGFATISNYRGLVFIDDDFSVDHFASNVHLSELEKQDEIDQRILEYYGKIIKPFEELEKLYSIYPEANRLRYLGGMINLALLSPDPIKTINNAIKDKHKLNARVKIVHYVSKNSGINIVLAESYLTDLIKNGSYFSDVKVDKLQS